MLNSPQWHWLGIALAAGGFLICLDAILVVKFPPPYRWLILLYAGYVIALGATYPFPTIEDHVVLFERYAEQWQGRNGFQLQLDEQHGLRNRFTKGQAYRLTPGVVHKHLNTTLTGVYIRLFIPEEISVQDVAPPWQHEYTRFRFHEYSYGPLPNIPDGSEGAQNVIEPLWLTFPTKHDYPIRFSIMGSTLTGKSFTASNRSFVVTLE